MADELAACPFCGDRMAMKGQVFGHTDSDLPCIIGQQAFAATPGKLSAWNTRKETPTEQGEPFAWRWRVMDSEGEWSRWFLHETEPGCCSGDAMPKSRSE